MAETYFKTYWKITKDHTEECSFKEMDEPFILREDNGWVDGLGYDEDAALRIISRWNRYGYPVVAFSLGKLTPETLSQVQSELSPIEDYRDGKIQTMFELSEVSFNSKTDH